MTQAQDKGLPAPMGVVYNTSMTRPDAALALAALYVSSSRREARVDGLCVTGARLDAAIYCDVVARFYTGQNRTPSSNAVLPIGFAAETPMPPSAAFLRAALDRLRANGQPQYTRGIQRVADTGAADALLRNAVTFTTETVVVLSAPATWLARAVALAGSVAQYKQRVKRVMIVEAGDVDRDAALKPLVAALPVPVLYCGREVGESLAVPRERFDAGFTWAPANPVADAVAAAGGTSVPLHDVAALHYTLHPDSGYFTVDDGRLTIVPQMKEECVAALVALVTSKPAAPPARGGGH